MANIELKNKPIYDKMRSKGRIVEVYIYHKKRNEIIKECPTGMKTEHF